MMIVGPDWIWLHFPKCGGTSAEALLRQNFLRDSSTSFDPIVLDNVIWHENITERMKRDPDFSPHNKKIVAILRRLPDWILSRVHFEFGRPPHHLVTREQLLECKFYENSGYLNSAESVFNQYDNPRVNFWVRIENLHEDFERFFDRKLSPISKNLNESKYGYIRNHKFWFTKSEIEGLYHNCPNWAEAEKRIYGRLAV